MSNKLYWHKQQEVVLKKWAETASSYRYLHDRSFQKYTSQNMWFAIPVIILSTITGTANFAQASFPESAKDIAPAIIGTLNLTAGLITTIAQFLRVSELLEGHRVASVAYGKFSRNITVELSLPVEERTRGGTEFLNNCRSELDKLIEQSPNIPINILKKFESSIDLIREKIDKQDINFYIDFIINSLFETNKYFNDQEPWNKKDNIQRLNTIVYTTLEIVRKISYMLYPIIPQSSLNALKIFNITEDDIKFSTLKDHNYLICGDPINKIDILFKKVEKKND